MAERRLAITLTLNGPVLTRSTAAGAYGVDAPVAKDAAGRTILPWSVVKGRLRQAWEELATLPGDPLDLGSRLPDWLGRGDDEVAASGGDHRRGRLIFSDFTSDDGETAVRHRIRIDSETGAVKPRFFQTVETPFAPGEEVRFEGEVRFIPRDDAEADAIERCLGAGLRWAPSFGAMRTVGFGRLVAVEIEPVAAAEDEPAGRAATGTAADGFDLAITFDEPFCLPRPQPVANLFESSEVVPGAALKGALATSWRELLGKPPDGPVTAGLDPDRPELCAHFERVRFTHAFPSEGEEPARPVAPPLSLVQVGGREEEDLHDVLLLPGPALLRTADGARRAPAFAPDWKGRGGVDRRFGWPELERELRVRTAIDRTTRRAASEQLFALETVVPKEGVVWAARVDLSRIEDAETRARVGEQVADLLHRGLRGLGKTKARARVEARPAGSIPAAEGRRERGDGGGPRAVLLQTPAILCDPETVRSESTAEGLDTAYASVWDELSGGALRPVRHFAAQDLAGGEYLWHEFQGGPDMPYEPYLLTRAGSVFLFEVVEGREEEAGAVLDRWEEQGLPLPEWAEERYARDGESGRHWTRCPYLPENGYGEVLVDREVHWSLRPDDDAVQILGGGAP